VLFEKLDEVPMEVLSLVESLNSLKQLFQEIKMVPDQPVHYKESEPKERQVTIDD